MSYIPIYDNDMKYGYKLMDLTCNNNGVALFSGPCCQGFDHLQYILQGVRRQWPGGEATYIPAVHTAGSEKPGG